MTGNDDWHFSGDSPHADCSLCMARVREGDRLSDYYNYPIDGSVPCGGSWHFESHSWHSACPACSNGWWDNTREPDGKRPSRGRHKPEFRTPAEVLEDTFPLSQDDYGVWWLKGDVHHIWIEKRPDYCDRGHYIAHVEPAPDAGLRYDIDHSDFWPRYYMDFNRMIAEIRDWLDWRENQNPSSDIEDRRTHYRGYVPR